MTVTTMNMLTSHDELGDAYERLDLQTRTTDECAVNVFLAHQLIDVVRLDAATIQDAARVAYILAAQLRQRPADEGVHFLGLRGRGYLARPDGPHRLVCNDQNSYSSCVPTQQTT